MDEWVKPTPTLEDVLNFIADARERLEQGDTDAALDALMEAEETVRRVDAG